MVALTQYHLHHADRHSVQAARPTSLEVYIVRCWARARLHADGELSLHEAIDILQERAESSGLIRLIGQDAVQAILAAEFGARQC